MALIIYNTLVFLDKVDIGNLHPTSTVDIKSHLSTQLRSLINIAESKFNTTLFDFYLLTSQASQLEPLEINIEIQQAVRDNNINIGDPDYDHNIDILLRSIIDRANLRRSATSSSTTDHQPLHLHHSGSASTSTTYPQQQQQRQQEEIDIGIIVNLAPSTTLIQNNHYSQHTLLLLHHPFNDNFLQNIDIFNHINIFA